jgi:hypothetical protein
MSYKKGFRSILLFRALMLGIGALFIFLASVPGAYAIPAFARKYQTSCTTCHTNFPELNDFGEAFKRNGFKFPKDDEEFVKDPPLMLGAKAQKQAFPFKAIYPGEIPGAIPISFRYSGFAFYNNNQPRSLGFVPRTDLFMPNTVTLLAAGSFGPSISFWIDDDLSVGGSGGAGGLGDGYLRVNDVGHYIHLPKDSLNLRFGQFELDLPFTQARTINLTDYDIYDEASVAGVQGSTNNPFLFGAPQRGIELGGFLNNGNFSWSAALVNGNNDGPAIRNSKDIYLRVSQKFNLERDANVRKEVQAAGPTGPRDHTSIRLGAFYYYGRNAINVDGSTFPGFGTIHEPFYRVGGDFRFKYRKMILYGVGMYGQDANLTPNADTGFVERGQPVKFSGGFVQSEYYLLPWVCSIMRYDFVNSSTDFFNGASRNFTRNRLTPGVQVLVRSNIKFALEYSRRFEQPIGDTGSFFRANGLVAGIDFTF